jgi:hypothetical protein
MTGATASLPPLARAAADNSIAAALPIAQRLGAAGRGLATAAQSAFSHGMWLSCLVLAAIVFAGMLTLLCLRLPRARRDSAPR